MQIKKRQILALLVTIAFLVVIFYKIDLQKLVETFKLFDLKNLLYIVPLYILTLYLRGIRWKMLLLGDKKYSSLELGELFTVGSMLNIYLPARAGDVYRAFHLGKTQSESKMKIFGSIILERTLDGICVFLILLFAILAYSKQAWILNIAYLIGLIFIGSFIVMYLIFKFNKVDFVCEKLLEFCKKFPKADFFQKIIRKLNDYTNSFIGGFEVLNSLKYTSESFVLSVIIWLLECVVAILIINSFNLSLGFSAGFFVISLISFSTMIPSTSVFLGPYQYAYILALSIYGVDKSTTLAISTVHQGILMLILTIIGGISLLRFNFQLKSQDKTIS